MPKFDFNKVAKQLKATLLKLHFSMGVLLYICCILPKHRRAEGLLLGSGQVLS